MKPLNCLILCLTTLIFTPSFAQQTAPGATTFSQRQRIQDTIKAAQGPGEQKLTKFSLDFPGGTPKQLVAAIEKAMSKPLNAIVPSENVDFKLPPLKMTDVTVPQLFTALMNISYKYDSARNVISSYGFVTVDNMPSDDAIWRFSVYTAQPSPTTLTRFDLDFPGGTPKQFIVAIEKAMGKPLNAIVPVEHADVKLPPLKMNNVDVQQLFQALESASIKTEAYVSGTYYGGSGQPSSSYQTIRTSYGFKTKNEPSDESVWYFYAEKPAFPPLVSTAKVCRFYSLASYLERGMTVDDITTAIQTGWKMLGEKETPTINYHKDTKLLIAVGEPNKLETIDAVLKALSPAWSGAMPVPPPASPVPAPRPIGKPKTEN